MEDLYPQLVALLQIIVIDVVLAGDNAIVVGLAASRVAPEIRAAGHLLGPCRRGRAAHPFRGHRDATARHHRFDPCRRHPAALGLLEDVPRNPQRRA